MTRYLNCFLLISFFLFSYVVNLQIKSTSLSEPSHTSEPAHSEHKHSYPVSEYPPLDMTEKDWPAKCAGEAQTPIDLPDKNHKSVTQSNGEIIKILRSEYKVVKGREFSNHDNKKWGMDLKGAGSLYVLKNGITYKYDLDNIHLHIFSEHTFNGERGDLEMHVVHMKDKKWLAQQGVTVDPDSKNEAIVLGSLWKAEGNKASPQIEDLNLGSGAPVKHLDLKPWASRTKNFWHYEGSLTVPKCNEFVNWVVYDGFHYMSESQFEAIKSEVFALYPQGNGRKVKPLNDRKLFYVNVPKCLLREN